MGVGCVTSYHRETHDLGDSSQNEYRTDENAADERHDAAGGIGHRRFSFARGGFRRGRCARRVVAEFRPRSKRAEAKELGQAKSNRRTSEGPRASTRISVSSDMAAPSPAFSSFPFNFTAPRAICTQA